jgi:phospholipase C
MGTNHSQTGSLRRRLLSCVAFGAIAVTTAPIAVEAADSPTATPIKHVIIIIGENRSFDHVFATYTPVNRSDTVLNLLSRKIIKADGTPGPEYNKARQSQAQDGLIYELSPGKKVPYAVLPPALVGGTATPYGCQVLGITTGTSCVTSANIAKIKTYASSVDSSVT